MESSRLSRLALRREGEWGIGASGCWTRSKDKVESELTPLVRVVETFEDLERVFALRNAAALAGDPPPTKDTEIDESDFGATHLVGFVGPRAVASLRLRVCGREAILDRFVIMASHNRRLFAQLRDLALTLCQARNVTIVTDETSEAARSVMNIRDGRLAVGTMGADGRRSVTKDGIS
ncbi:hypothetical protein FHS85_004328 [Rhodoligotrophos appendicifer]|uniref:hypothetical protein n=1 Tax=Rhodoligotrophos appendicifer TaxID=987056 RepID=UPI001186B7BF|nr:hypothetical protein [Rhodoligotrophos appendicifer]